ncbi:MAG: mandelate racemase/muconate lactonizing enzyme family protein [bacterium]|nr:mandelate racemase/muconate lactonizing enzyme family protein [bacterium]
MSYKIESLSFFVRETLPARFPSALGKAAISGEQPKRETSPICHLRLVLSDSSGETTWGCSADRLSVRWLDKRPGRDTGLKRRELAVLLEQTRQLYMEEPNFDSPFAKWLRLHPLVMQRGRAMNQESLTSAFASSLFERALLDAVCRLAERPLFVMLKQDALGINLADLNSDLAGQNLADYLPQLPTTEIAVRHTVGLFDPLTDEDWPAAQRVHDGLPETLQEYIQQQGIRYFKVKLSGDVAADLKRLARLWDIMPFSRQPVITLDANEAFADVENLANFVSRLQKEQLGLFQHVAYIEQPLPRNIALLPRLSRSLRDIGRMKPLIIDESDGTLDSCRQALNVGYAGTSHKNCKGFYKSLANMCLLSMTAAADPQPITILSGEDLQNLPVVPLQQDLISVGCLGLTHCERNGHHYNHGLSMLPPDEKQKVLSRHPDLYAQRNGEGFLRIQAGMIQCDSLHQTGYGIQDEPDWSSMQPMSDWLQRAHPQ